MGAEPLSYAILAETERLYFELGSQEKAADALNISRSALAARLKTKGRKDRASEAEGEYNPTEIANLEGQRFILTSAQSGTAVFKPFWKNLVKYANHIGAELMVARFRYNVSAQQAKQSKTNSEATNADWYADELSQYFFDERVKLCEGLIWAGDMNIMPTAVDPLSGLDSFTGLDSCIFPHAKIAMKSIATAMSDPRKKNYTTGTVTLSNYIKRKAGQKAEFHHAYGALLVEVDDEGDFFVRQLNADDTGAFCDLGAKVSNGRVSKATVAALGAGDIHARNIDPVVRDATWGEGGLVDTLRPERQFFGDVLDFESRSHHNTLFDSYRLHCKGTDCVEAEIEETHDCIKSLMRPWCQTFVKKGNHDEHLERWLREGNFKTDLGNAPFYLEAMAAKLRSISQDDDSFDLLQWALERFSDLGVTFIPRNTVVEVAGIDMGQHGDAGPNGSRGTVRNLAKTGRKVNIEHSHSAHIVEGAYQAGTSTRLDMSYVNGPSSWSHVHILTHDNGKRQMIEIKNGKWRAEIRN